MTDNTRQLAIKWWGNLSQIEKADHGSLYYNRLDNLTGREIEVVWNAAGAPIDQWIAEVKWNQDDAPERFINQENTEFIGPFDEYDTGIKMWSAEFSAKNAGKFEWIDYHRITHPYTASKTK